jgi:hypothetical protein
MADALPRSGDSLAAVRGADIRRSAPMRPVKIKNF